MEVQILFFNFSTGVRAAWERVKSDARAAATERTSRSCGSHLHPGNGESWAASSGANPTTDPGRGEGKVIIYCLHVCKVSVLWLLLWQVQTETTIVVSVDVFGRGHSWGGTESTYHSNYLLFYIKKLYYSLWLQPCFGWYAKLLVLRCSGKEDFNSPNLASAVSFCIYFAQPYCTKHSNCQGWLQEDLRLIVIF